MSEKQRSIFTLLYLKKIQTRNQVLWSGKTSCYCTSFCIIILRNTYFTLSCKSRRAADEIFNFVGTSCQRPMGYELSPQLCGFATTKRKMKTLVNNQSTSENARVASGSIAQMCEKPFSWKQSIKNWLKTTKNGGKIGFCLFKMDSKNSEKKRCFLGSVWRPNLVFSVINVHPTLCNERIKGFFATSSFNPISPIISGFSLNSSFSALWTFKVFVETILEMMDDSIWRRANLCFWGWMWK